MWGSVASGNACFFFFYFSFHPPLWRPSELLKTMIWSTFFLIMLRSSTLISGVIERLTIKWSLKLMLRPTWAKTDMHPSCYTTSKKYTNYLNFLFDPIHTHSFSHIWTRTALTSYCFNVLGLASKEKYFFGNTFDSTIFPIRPAFIIELTLK